MELWIDKARRQRGDATPLFDATLTKNTLHIRSYAHPGLSDLLSDTSEDDLSWRHVIESVLIDPAYDGIAWTTICDARPAQSN